MEKPQDEQIIDDKLQNEQTLENNLYGEHETVNCQVGDNLIEIENVVIIHEKENNMQADTLSKVKDADQSANSSGAIGEVENLQEVSSINLSDVYSNGKFGHDFLQLLEHGHSLENWHHGSYQDTVTDSFSHMQVENVPPIQQYINADIQSTSGSTLTLTVLNSTNTDEENTQPISFSFAQPDTYQLYGSNLADHDYCIYPKSGYPVMDGIHGPVDNSAFMQQPEQHEPGMDQEKLLRMKRRKEKNRECSRQFRLKQKNKEENLTKGKVDKVKELENLRKSVEKIKTTLSKAAMQCSSKCPKTRMLLSQYGNVNKENINPDHAKIIK